MLQDEISEREIPQAYRDKILANPTPRIVKARERREREKRERKELISVIIGTFVFTIGGFAFLYFSFGVLIETKKAGIG